MQSLYFALPKASYRLPIYVTGVGHKYQTPVHRRYGIADFHWLHTLRGVGTVELLGERRPLPRGHGFLMFPDLPHRYWPEERWEVMWLTFNGDGTAAFLEAWGLRTGFYALHDVQALSSLLHGMLRRGLESSPHQALSLTTLAYRFIEELVQQSTVHAPAHKHRRRLQPLLDYIAEHLDAPLTLTQMAEVLGVSPQHVCRLFRHALGTTPYEYVVQQRMIKAKALLVDEPEMPVAEVARRVGYTSPSHFTALFKAREHRTPTEFRLGPGRARRTP